MFFRLVRKYKYVFYSNKIKKKPWDVIYFKGFFEKLKKLKSKHNFSCFFIIIQKKNASNS